MNRPSWHVHVSERQPGAWVDCTADSTVEFARLCHDKAIPATHAEGDALRTASGRVTTGGLNTDNMVTAIAKRYAWTAGFKKVSGFSALWSALAPGCAAMVQGSMVAFPPTSTYSRFDPTFDGGHAVCVMRLDSTDRVWWCDPEAPSGSYKGEWMSKADLARFVNAFAGSHLVANILPEAVVAPPITGVTMPNLATYTPGKIATVKATSNIRSDAKLTASKYRTLTAAETHPIIGTVLGDVDPQGGSNVWYAWWANGRYEYTAASNVTTVADPASGFTQADIDRAIATQQEKDVATCAASTEAAVSNAVANEQKRIREVLGL